MKLLLLFPLLATACATMPPPAEPTGPCAVTEPMRARWIGTKFRMRDRDAIQRDANARIARVLNPGDMATQDLRTDRLDILLDDGGQIDGLRCG